jgi:hypothetical protein
LATLFFAAGILLLVLMPVSIAVARYRSSTLHAAAVPEIARAFHGTPGVVVVFQPRDCAGFDSFIDAFSSLSRQRAGQVLGIPVNSPPDTMALRRSLAEFSPAFPLAPRLDADAERLLSAIGFARTPLAIVVDRAGRPVMVVPPQPNPYRQAEMTRLVASYLDLQR